MKSIRLVLLIFFICLSAKNANAQLQNSAWKGVFFVPNQVECVFEFKKDTVYLRGANNFILNEVNENTILEKSLYTVENDILTIKKVDGGSPCDTDVIGMYRIEIKDEKLSLIPIWDGCSQRVSAFPGEPLTKLSNKEVNQKI